jgi:HD-like signal output (HDOD) protein
MTLPEALPAADAGADQLARDLKIPPCPAVLAAFSAEVRKDDPDTRILGALIANDAGLAAAVLKAVNSPLFGLNRKAADIPQALAILGLRAATHLITSLLLRQAFPAAAGGLMQRYWEDSSSIADAAIAIAGRVRGVSRDEAHTYALFRNCGIAVMIARFADYGSIVDAHAAGPGPQLELLEESRYRYHHALVGYALARGWHLPDAIVKTIRFHHQIAQVAARTGDAAQASPELLAVGLLAEQVARLRCGRGTTGEWNAHEAFALETLRLAPEDIVALVQAPAPGSQPD